jgi:hypothetical protein
VSRKIEKCTSCGKEDKIAGHGLCFACYRQVERAIKRKRGADDAVQLEDKRLLRLYAATINNMVELGMTREDILAIKKTYLDRCVSSVAMYLSMSAEEESE